MSHRPRRVAIVLAGGVVILLPLVGASIAPAAQTAPTYVAGGPATFRIATFNLLGASHTVSGPNADLGSGEERMGRSVRLLDRRAIELVGLQEMQPVQVAEFRRLRGEEWGLFPGSRLRPIDGANSIAWRRSVWLRVDASTRAIPYFDGRERNMPVVTLRHRATGRRLSVLNVHNPASNRKHGNQDYWRAEAVRREIAAVKELRAANPSVPVFLTGDFNDREKAFCPIAGQARMRAANGGRATATTCTMPPKPWSVDWIFGTRQVAFDDYRQLRNRYVRQITDHPLIFADATVPPPTG